MLNESECKGPRNIHYMAKIFFKATVPVQLGPLRKAIHHMYEDQSDLVWVRTNLGGNVSGVSVRVCVCVCVCVCVLGLWGWWEVFYHAQ